MLMHPFDSLVELESGDIRLDCAALQLARDVYPHIDVPKYLARLDGLAAEVAAERPGLAAPLRYTALREVLVERHGFRGNQDDYYDSRNSYLNCVLDRGVGIPISLGAIWTEVGRRLKWNVAGVPLPGHFVVRIDDPERFILIDPFGEGRSLSLEDCKRLVKDASEGKSQFHKQMLKPADTRATLSRMLANLRSIYLNESNWTRLADVLARLIALEPECAQHRQELAAVRYQIGDLRGAYAHLLASLRQQADGDRNPALQQKLYRLEAAIASLN